MTPDRMVKYGVIGWLMKKNYGQILADDLLERRVNVSAFVPVKFYRGLVQQFVYSRIAVSTGVGPGNVFNVFRMKKAMHAYDGIGV